MEGMSLDFHCFKALNNNLEARLFLHVYFYASSDLLMACRTMQLRLFKLGTVLTYAFNMFRDIKIHVSEALAHFARIFTLKGNSRQFL